MNPSEQYQLLVESLRLLAASAGDQRQALPDFVVATDEIVSTFSDAFMLVPQLERAGLIGASGGTAIRAVDMWLASMPQDGSVIDASTLETHEFWIRARPLAREALQAFGEEARLPNVHRTTWIRAND